MHGWYLRSTAVISVRQTAKHHQMGQEDNTEPPKGNEHSYSVYNSSSGNSSGTNGGRGVQRPADLGPVKALPQV